MEKTERSVIKHQLMTEVAKKNKIKIYVTQDIQLHTWETEDKAKFPLVGSVGVKILSDKSWC